MTTPLCLPPVVKEISWHSIASLALGVVSVLVWPFNRCVVVSHYSNLQFSKTFEIENLSVHLLVICTSSLMRCPFRSFVHFLNHIVHFLMVKFLKVLCIFWITFIRYVFWKYFLPVFSLFSYFLEVFFVIIIYFLCWLITVTFCFVVSRVYKLHFHSLPLSTLYYFTCSL